MANGNGMHIEKSVSIGHIVSIVLLAMTLAGYAMFANDRITTNSVKIEENRKRMDRTEARVGGSLDRIEEKLDHMIQREMDRNK